MAQSADAFKQALLGTEESIDSAACTTVTPPRYSSLSSATLTLAISAAGAGMLSFPYAGTDGCAAWVCVCFVIVSGLFFSRLVTLFWHCA